MFEIAEYNLGTGHREVIARLELATAAEAKIACDQFAQEDSNSDHVYYWSDEEVK